MSALEVFPVDDGPDMVFRPAHVAGLRAAVAAAWAEWHAAGSDADADEGETSEELHARYVELLERYAGIEFK